MTQILVANVFTHSKTPYSDKTVIIKCIVRKLFHLNQTQYNENRNQVLRIGGISLLIISPLRHDNYFPHKDDTISIATLTEGKCNSVKSIDFFLKLHIEINEGKVEKKKNIQFQVNILLFGHHKIKGRH